ncbi:thiol:disulfide interchange protein DsbA/DsbL [Inhella sp.]|uniref:thiol:disulfide interchange protein DsbA/DsbL n=1 Tax=Inhella sp. TaxID=1921806 RepID=UPI0035AFE6FA
MNPLNPLNTTRRQALVLGSSALAASALAQPAFREGFHYKRLPSRLPGTAGKIDVLEFFWYGCPHCYAFEPVLGPWVKQLPANVEFRHVHVFFRENTRGHQRLFYTLQAMAVEHQFRPAIFKAIHEQGNMLETPEAMVKLLKPLGLDEAKFSAAWKSFEPKSFSAARIDAANRLTAAYELDGVPAMGIGGLFLTSPGMAARGERMTEADSGRRCLQLAEQLIKQVPAV